MLWLKPHIGGQLWRVYLVGPRTRFLLDEDTGDRLLGKCDYARCKIYVSKALDESARSDVLWHELMHALLHVTGAEQVYGGDPKKDERLVSTVTPAMHRLLCDLGFRFPRGPNR